MDLPNILEKSIGSEKIFSNNPRSQKIFKIKVFRGQNNKFKK